MTMTIQEISDRMEIQDLLVAYSTAVDTQDWKAFAALFTPDALIDYSAMGGSRGGVEETVAFLEKSIPNFSSTQHLVANSAIELQGDRAVGRTMCHNPMVMKRESGEEHVFFCGLWYRDEFVRTPEGWRFQTRVEEKSYFHNLPDDFEFPE